MIACIIMIENFTMILADEGLCFVVFLLQTDMSFVGSNMVITR